MIFSDPSVWVTLVNDEASQAHYLPQLKVFVADPANPEPSEMIRIMETLDLANGSITISYKDGGIEAVQDGQTIYPYRNLMTITGSTSTSNTITVDSSVKNDYKITLKNADINIPESGIRVSSGASVEFVLKSNNSVTSTSCEKKTDYAAIEVQSGATATFFGDGTLNAEASGYGAAIGIKAYYRDGKNHSDNSKFSGIVKIKGAARRNATSVYGVGIGGGAINGSSCIQKAFDNGAVYISEDAIAEATRTEGYSAGIGGGCYIFTCEATAGDGGVIEAFGNAKVTAKCENFFRSRP